MSLSAAGQEVLLGHSTAALASTVAPTEAFDETVVPITEVKLGLGIEGKFGTGFCLDPSCRFIGTSYHVAKMARPHNIGGEKVVQRYLATGPDDESATVNDGPSGSVDLVPIGQHSMRYTLNRDLAIFELRHSLPNHHGVAFSLDDLQVGQEIDIYSYPKQTINPIRKLLQFHGTFKGQTTTGLLAFDYSLNADRAIRPGASGGIVVDRKSQQIVGILNGTAKDGEAIALAVPVQSLVGFVTKVEPYLAQSIFPSTQGISPVSADLYPKYVPSSANVLQHRAEESPEVKLLRSKGQLLADSMRNFIAVQTLAWGAGDHEPTAQAVYEVRVLDGYQRFRSYPNGKKEVHDIPFPPLNKAMVPGGEWSELPEMVGTELRLKIQQAPDVVVADRRIKVFQYRADIEDGVCTWKDETDLVFLAFSRTFTVACYGEVWTDEDTNILRVSEHYELPGKWRDFQGVVTYGWLERAGEPRLTPLTFSTQAEFHKKIYWCRGQFMDYQMFSAQTRIMASQPGPDLPRAPQRAD
jgi:hypothetical protein